jgi:hypothetical protein
MDKHFKIVYNASSLWSTIAIEQNFLNPIKDIYLILKANIFSIFNSEASEAWSLKFEASQESCYYLFHLTLHWKF